MIELLTISTDILFVGLWVAIPTVAAILICLVAYVLYSRRTQQSAFRGGICSRCDTKLNLTEWTDRGRVWRCPSCGYFVWITRTDVDGYRRREW